MGIYELMRSVITSIIDLILPIKQIIPPQRRDYDKLFFVILHRFRYTVLDFAYTAGIRRVST